ncbi:hypothetical protein Adt_35437 [Abeliophyllum distichum]|uniref:Uncharacterized protein n=1 Tax=Abeliophyllum distichum TaxID=126358 RepID=A0ABD1QIQ7_9LAMI
MKLIRLHIEDASFATDQTESHLEVGNTGYGNYDSSAKRRLLVSLEIFLRIYYKGGMLGPKATGSCSGVTVISEYCKGNRSAVEYPLGLKLIGLHIEDVSFATDQTKHHLEVGNTSYGNYDSSTKRRLLVSLGIFLRIYYKGGMLGKQSASLLRASVLTEGQLVG